MKIYDYKFGNKKKSHSTSGAQGQRNTETKKIKQGSGKILNTLKGVAGFGLASKKPQTPATHTGIRRIFHPRSWNWNRILVWSLRVAAVGIIALAGIFIYFSRTLPNPNKLLDRNVAESTKIYDREGGLLYEVHGEVKRTQVNLDQINDDVEKATIAIEDKDFYKHKGVSITGIIRSVLVNTLSGKKAQGGSTLTQQFVKNAILTREKSILRKVKEIVLSIEIEAKFNKDEILKLYLNEIPYGRNSYGIEAASESYFNKKASDLSLAEAAYMAAIAQAPSYYNPSGPHFDALQNRQKLVLKNMLEQGYIDQARYDEALNQKVEFSRIKTSIKAPHFVMYIQDYLATKYGEQTLQEGGLKVTTTLDPKLQEMAETSIRDGVNKAAKQYGANNGALVAIDPKTGQILAMVGSKDYFGETEPAGCESKCLFDPQVNVATSLRQPGSSFKPYVYLTGFKGKYSPGSVLLDLKTNFGNYSPDNYNGRSNGPVTIRKALAGSLNISAVKMLDLVGVQSAVTTAQELGITSDMSNCGLSLVLGGCEVKLLDHTAAMATVANLGVKNDKTGILKVEDKSGSVLEEYQSMPKQVVDPQAAYEVVDIMTDNNARAWVFGSSSPLAFPGKEVGCKTGTTQEWKDGWTMCYTPNIAVGVWVGNNNSNEMKRGSDAVFSAAPISNSFLKASFTVRPAEKFTTPKGITKVTLDNLTGLLPTDATPSTHTDIAASFAIPKERDYAHKKVIIDSVTGFLATDATPESQRQEKVCADLRSEKPKSPAWEGPVQAWLTASGQRCPGEDPNPTPRPTVSISSPENNSTVSSNTITVQASAQSGIGISKIEVFVDGVLKDSTTESSATFKLSGISSGTHTIAVKATDTKNQTADTSVQITYTEGSENNATETLQISSPSNGASIAVPATLIATSNTEFNTVQFYYKPSSGSATLIPGAASQSGSGSSFTYTKNWSGNVPAGTYTLYAESNSGVESNTISVTVQ